MAPGVAIAELTAGYGPRTALHEVAFTSHPGRVTAIIGPSGCGKSTLLRCINRLHEEQPLAWVRGQVQITRGDQTGGDVVYDAEADVAALRRRIGMVFQRPTPFVTMSIFENVAAGVRAHEPQLSPRDLEARVTDALRRAGLWREVADRLNGNAMALSGGQQQRLCLARALAVGPRVLLLDEPTASLDPLGTQRIEELIYDLRGSVTMIMVTHNMQQAARISDDTVFLLQGKVVERATTRQLFTAPRDPRTEAYITGRFG
ncbi:MAG: phosphate ABC transporter ATP-binding protein [Gemmatimonadaceae bacterium]|nr:phosphate ABC transporter ATP-binding protein [Gemmatimonadaceae bacterium]